MAGKFSNRHIGDYLVEEFIGQRAAIEMYRATQTSLPRLVLFKTIAFNSIAEIDVHTIQGIQEHINAVSTLEHMHLQPIYGSGVLDDSHFYIAGRLIIGSLANLLRAGALPLDVTFKFATQTTMALSYIHAQGYIHNSLSPYNIYIGDDGNAYINDLELSPLVQAACSLRELKDLLDVPFYASVEQLQLRQMDVRSEIYAFGAILYHMVTGVPPFSDADNSFEAALERKLHNQLVAPRQLTPSLPPQLESVILRSLRADPQERYSDVTTMERELKRSVQDEDTLPEPVKSWLDNLSRLFSRKQG